MKKIKWNSYWDRDNQVPNDLKIMEGATIVEITGAEEDNDEVIFTLDNGYAVKLHHVQDCCESVYIADVIGDPEDLIGAYVVEA